MAKFAIVAAMLLAGCAVAPLAPVGTAWIPDEGWWAEAIQSAGWFHPKDGSAVRVNAENARNLYQVARKVLEQSSVAAKIALIDLNELNAFAIESGGVRQIVFPLPLLEAIGGDRDALATIIGHEAAHLHYGHNPARKVRNQLTMGDSAAIPGILAVNMAISRFEEREADIKGIEWAVAAGFSPCGSARTMRVLRAHHASTGDNTSLSMHPGYRQGRCQRCRPGARETARCAQAGDGAGGRGQRRSRRHRATARRADTAER